MIKPSSANTSATWKTWKPASFLQEATNHLYSLTNCHAETVVCDLHPKFTTTALAKEMAEADGLPLIQVQHHHAHAAALMAEHDLEEAVTLSAMVMVTDRMEKLGAAKSCFAHVNQPI